jgi:hypothetical protein
MWRRRKKMKKVMIRTTVVMSVLGICSSTLADRPLERSEILDLLENLTAQPRTTWISSGTIQAVHTEYGAPKTTDEQEITDVIIGAFFRDVADAHLVFLPLFSARPSWLVR